MTNIDLILETLEELMPSFFCDDCLSKQVGITPRQQVNALCNKLNSQGLILRKKAPCARCGHLKLVNSLNETFRFRFDKIPSGLPCPSFDRDFEESEPDADNLKAFVVKEPIREIRSGVDFISGEAQSETRVLAEITE